jgi:hypothetical protein
MKLNTSDLKKILVKTAGYRRFLLVACSFLFLFLLPACQAAKPGVYIQKLKNQHYRLIVNGRPYIVKGVCYSPVPIGKNHEYEWQSDPNKPWLVDGKLMKEMGINTIRLYQASGKPEDIKKVIKDLYEFYGIHTILGDWLGFWEYPCPFYGDKKFQDKVKHDVLEMVKTYKDEPGVLMWVLGNENNYSCLGHVNPWSSEEVDKELDPVKRNALRAKIYYSFVNDIAKEIHKIDYNHPVALGNGELVGLDSANKYAPDVDLVACIIYRGKSFESLFQSLKRIYDKPILLAEFGADAYDAYLKKEDQNMQSFFLEAQWKQIYANLWNTKKGEGNCLGGTSFEWTDEWWKHNESDPQGWSIHDTEGGWFNPSYYFDNKAVKNMNEEWFGIVAISSEMENGINKRTPRKAYYVIREFWKNPVIKKTPGKKSSSGI